MNVAVSVGFAVSVGIRVTVCVTVPLGISVPVVTIRDIVVVNVTNGADVTVISGFPVGVTGYDSFGFPEVLNFYIS